MDGYKQGGMQMTKKFKISLAAAIVVIMAIVSVQMVFAVEEEPGPWWPGPPPNPATAHTACLSAGGTNNAGLTLCFKTCDDGTTHWARVKCADGGGLFCPAFKWEFSPNQQCKASGPALVCSNLGKPAVIYKSFTLPITFTWKCSPGEVTSATLKILVDPVRMRYVYVPLTLGGSGTVMASELPGAGKYNFWLILTNQRSRFILSGGNLIIEE